MLRILGNGNINFPGEICAKTGTVTFRQRTQKNIWSALDSPHPTPTPPPPPPPPPVPPIWSLSSSFPLLTNSQALDSFYIYILCPFAVYYIRYAYAVRSFFTMSRISLADGKRAGQKVQRKVAVAVQKVKSPLLFVPLFWNQQNKLSTIILLVLIIKLTKERRRRVSRGRD